MTRRPLSAGMALGLAIGLLLGPAPIAAQTAAELDAQITNLDQVIDMVSDVQKLQKAIHTLKEHVRVTDVIEQYSGDQAGGIGYELRQIYDLASKLDPQRTSGFGPAGELEDTRLGTGVDIGRKVHAVLSAVDAVAALAAGQEASGPDRLRLMAQYIGALNDAIGVLSLEVNPIIDATLGVYAKALESAADVAEHVIAPRTAAVNEAIAAAGNALGSEDGAADEFEDVLDQLYGLRADLKRKRAELETPNVDYLAARGNCLRTLGIDYDEVIDRENDVERARHKLMDIAEDLAEAERTITGAEMAIRDLQTELENATDRRRRGDISAREPSTIQAEIDAENNNIRYAREKIRRLEEDLRNAAPDYEAKLQTALSFKDCIRTILSQYAEQALDELPIQYKDCTFWDLPESVATAVANARTKTRAGDRVETGGGNAPAGSVPTGGAGAGNPPDELPPVVPPARTLDAPARTGEPKQVGATTPSGGGGTALAMRSGPPGDLVPTVEPIHFTIYPYELQPVATGGGVDLRNETANAINFPILIAAGPKPRVQIVILAGSPNRTRTRSPPAETQPSGAGLSADDPVPGGGILFYDPDLKVLFRGLGTLGKEAVEMQVFGADPDAPVSAEGLVVEPVELAEEAKQRLEAEVRELASQNPITAKLDAYCLAFLQEPPSLGTVFRVADQSIQQQFAPLARVLQAGRRLYEAGLLNPDSDPEEYFHSIRQWALWSVQENLDAGGFGEAFLEQTRKNFEIAGQAWTGEVEELVKSLVPNRWNDIAAIVEEARSAGAAPAGGGPQ